MQERDDDEIEALKSAVDCLIRLAKIRADEELELKCRRLEARLNSFRFTLVIVGQTGRGKSTLINALLGASVIPTSETLSAAVTTTVQYGTRAQAGVHQSDDEISATSIFFPSQFLRNGIRIVEARAADLLKQHCDRLNDYLSQADAAVFVFASDHPVTRSELDALQMCRKLNTPSLAVLNKSDWLSDEESRESLRYLESALSSSTASVTATDQPQTFALSAEHPDANEFKAFRETLDGMIIQRMKSTATNQVRTLAVRFAHRYHQLIELERQCCATDRNKLQSSLERIRRARRAIGTEYSDLERMNKHQIQKFVQRFERDTFAEVEQCQQSVITHLEHRIGADSTRQAYVSTEQLLNELPDCIAPFIRTLSDLATQRRNSDLFILSSRFQKQANRIVAKIESLTLDIHGIRMSDNSPVHDASAGKSKQSHSTADSQGALSLDLAIFFPDWFSQSLIRNQLLNCARAEVVRQARHLVSGYQKCLASWGDSVLQDFKQRVDTVLKEMERAVSYGLQNQNQRRQKPGTPEETFDEQSRLLQQIAQILGIELNIETNDFTNSSVKAGRAYLRD